MKVTIKDVRMAFPALWEPDSIDGGAPAYRLKLIIPPKHPAVKILDDAILAVATEKWKGKAPAILKACEAEARKKMCFVKADYANDEGVVYDGFEDAFYFGASNPVQPLIIDRDKTELTMRDGRPYSGCRVVVQAEIWAQDNKWGKGMRATLLGVQFFGDGDAFAGGTKANLDDFEDLSDTGEDDDLA